jgi:opacity protein-like surface antigen
MKAASVLGCVFAGCCLCLSAHSARAQENPLGLYLDAGIGTATLRQEPGLDTGYYGLSRETFGWDAFIGVRPLPYLGAEIGYLDFGSTNRFGYYPGIFLPEHASANAPAGFAVGYLPVQPWWDLYLKAGAARLHRTWGAFPASDCGNCEIAIAYAPYSASTTDWDFAWGAGTQWKFGPMALRLEYQRVSTDGNAIAGDPDLLTVGVSWTLF